MHFQWGHYRRRSGRPQRARSGRRLSVEPLEDRSLLAIDAFLSAPSALISSAPAADASLTSDPSTAAIFESLYSFNTSATDAANPLASLVQVGSTLYGTTISGGAAGEGSIFAMNMDGSNFRILHSFSGADGARAYSGMTLVGTTFYGTTAQGGASGAGTIYEINLDGSGFQTLYSFEGDDGAVPLGNLSLVGTSLYGMTSQGGEFGAGNIYSLSLGGTNFQLVHSFDGDQGANPVNALTQIGSVLYGTTSQGGASDNGTVFSMSLDGSDFHIIHDFNGDDGSKPYARLTESVGMLYGTTTQGGEGGGGTIFAIVPDGSGFSTLHAFSGGDGAQPAAGLTLMGTSLYGATATGDSAGSGNVFALRLDGSDFRTLHSFAGNDGATTYSPPTFVGLSLVGVSVFGGSGDGVAYSVSLDGASFAVLHSFAATAAGHSPPANLTAIGSTLYGVTADGGSGGQGTVFSMNPDGSNLVVLHSFSVGTSDGAKPAAALAVVGDTLYGTTTAGGSANLGTVFSIKIDGSNFSILHSFSSSDGQSPAAALTVSGSTLYGTASGGGVNGGGTLFSLSIDGSNFRVIHAFGGGASDGRTPTAAVTLVGSALVGTTSTGGSADQGTIYSLNPDGTSFGILHSFAAATSFDGTSPSGLTLLGSSLYGTAATGGLFGRGTLFSLSTDGSQFKVLHSFAGGNTDGRTPRAALVRAGAKLYGTTSAGGTGSNGVVFAINPDGSNFELLHSFAADGGDGSGVSAGLALIDATLFGVSAGGGAAGVGTVFAINGAVTLPAPQITGVQVANSHWSASYLAYLASTGLGNGSGYAIPVGSSAQSANLPIGGVDQIQVIFSENVVVPATSLTIASINVASYPIGAFSYNPATLTATWTLAAPIDYDTIVLTLSSAASGGVTDTQGTALDGEWSNAVGQFPSGNNSAGGDFHFRFNLLSGDGNRDGTVNGLDIAATVSRWLQSGSSIGDANGDGIVNGLDIAAISSHWLGRTYNPTQLGSNLQLLLDPNDASSMTFRPVRQVVATQNQSFSRVDTGADDVFNFQGDGTASKFTVGGWFRFDGGLITGEPIIGKAGTNGLSWEFIVSGPASFEFAFGDASGTWGGYKIWSDAFNPGFKGVISDCWLNLVFVYDGSQAGDENIAKLYINGLQVPTAPGNILPAVVGNPGGSDAALSIGGGFAGGYSNLSFCDVALAADVPANPDAAVADLWNNGFGVQYSQWPASLPALLAYYQGDDNWAATGVAPSGDLADATGHGYTLGANNAPTGSLQVVDWRDESPNHLLFQFGYDPGTGYRSRVYEAQYSPTVRNGLPGVIVPGLRASGSVKAGFAYTAVEGIALMGSSGSMFGDFILNTTSTSNDLLSICDDQTHAGDSTNGITQVLALGAISENYDLLAMGEYSFANLHTYNAEGNPLVQLVGPGDIENIAGNELFGLSPDGTPNGSSIVNGNTYILTGQQTSLMLTNTNDGSYGGNAVAGPYQIYVNNQAQVVYVDDGGAGRVGNIWASSYSNLSSIVLNGYAEVAAGVPQIYAVNSTTYGPMGIVALLGDAQQGQLRRWLLLN